MNRDSTQGDGKDTRLAPPSPGGVFPLVVAAVTALLVFVLFSYIHTDLREKAARNIALSSLDAARASLAATWKRSSELADLTARQLAGVEAVRIPAIIRQFKAVWPQAGFAVYDRKGELLSYPPASKEPVPDIPPTAHTVRGIVLRALVGQEESGISQVRGYVSLSTAMPVQSGPAGALVVSLPLDSEMLRSVKQSSGVDLAVLPFSGLNTEAIDVSAASGTFAGMPGFTRSDKAESRAGAWPYIAKRFEGKNISAEELFTIPGEEGCFVAAPLTGADGTVFGALVTVSSLAPLALDPLWPWALTLGAALAAGLASMWALRRKAEYLSQAYAGAVKHFAQSEAGSGGLKTGWEVWPEAIQDAFASISSLLRRYRERAREAERRQLAACESGDEGMAVLAADLSAGREDFLRLFAVVPVGVFHADASGHFVRVNQAFAELLGYDSPARLISDKPKFGAFFLYGEDILNPLSAFASYGLAGRIVNLRASDGKVRNYTLSVVSLTSSSGEETGVYECFLRGRSLEESVARADKERIAALQQQSSIALLLASTCLQIQRYLDRSLTPPARAAEQAQDAGDCPETQVSGERRQGVRSALSVLDDIYQIAKFEAGQTPLIFLSVDFAAFFKSLGEQVRPALLARGMSLRCEISSDLPVILSAPEAPLRHALERALLCVAAPVQEGIACVSMRRDMNAPSAPGLERVVFSIAWSREGTAETLHGRSYDGPLMSVSYESLFEIAADPEAALAPSAEEPVVLDVAEEETVLASLARRMKGEFVETSFLRDQRSMEFMVPLARAVADDTAPDGTEETAPAFAAPGQDGVFIQTADAPEEESVYMPEGEDSLEAYAAEHGQNEYFPGMGVSSLVTETVPDYAASDSLAADIAEADDSQEENAAGSGLNILLIDSNMNSRMMFSMFMSGRSHKITEAHDGQAGVETFHKGRFDIVFLDMDMPLMDGYQVTRIIRALEAEEGLAPTPIVGMTSYALPEFRQRCILAGCTEFLSRPFTKHALDMVIDAFLKHSAKDDPEQDQTEAGD